MLGVSFRWLFALAAGVVLPAITLGYELLYHGCADQFFDPIPTQIHVVLITIVIAGNFASLIAIAKGLETIPTWLNFLNGASIGIAGLYSIVFAPILPLAAMFSLFFIGLMPLAPLFSLIVAIGCRFKLTQADAFAGRRRMADWMSGIAASLVVLGTIHGHDWLVRNWIRQVSEGTQEEQQAALQNLRRFGGEANLLQACYWNGRDWFFDDRRQDDSAQQARVAFYRLTGDMFDQRPRPALHSRRLSGFDAFDFDEDRGGTQVGVTQRGLSLAASRMDATVESDAGLAYVEWTLEFKNASQAAREARTQIALPPGGIVSRVTLWVNGEEREAAFAARGKARQAYQQVAVRQQRDPVLVSTSGPDQILVQCFPVPAGGTMKTRIGVTAPLDLAEDASGILRLPNFVERNFSIPSSVKHSIWVISDSEFRNLGSEYSKNEVQDSSSDARPKEKFHIRGECADEHWKAPARSISVSRNRLDNAAWAAIEGDFDSAIVVQSIEIGARPVPKEIVCVIESSKCMSEALPQIAGAISARSSTVPLRVIVARDCAATELSLDGVADRQLTIKQLNEMHAVGGSDSVAALAKAWDLADKLHGDVLWIHGPQPIELSSPEPLMQRIQRGGTGAPRIYTLQVADGPNRVLESFDGEMSLHRLPAGGDIKRDVTASIESVASGKSPTFISRKRVVGSERLRLKTRPASKHLVRLWAAEEVLRLRAERNPNDLDRAIRLATQQQLVTPVSAAVVLENAQQYAQNGLVPVEAASVPTIPEPGTALAILIGAAILLRRRCARC